MVCDMCGSDKRLYRAEVEGTVLNVCEACAKFGQVKGPIPRPEVSKKKEFKPVKPISKDQLLQRLVEDFSEIIKTKREKLGLKQEDFAKKINEKESLIQKIETGNFKPSIKLARKIEGFLKVSLVEQMPNSPVAMGKSKTESFTLGDFIRVKK